MGIKRASGHGQPSKVDRLKADIAAYRLEYRTQNVLPEHRSRAAQLLLEEGWTQMQLGAAIGVSGPTISRWVAKAAKVAATPDCRELVLVEGHAPELGWATAKPIPEDRIFLNLPNGLQFDLPLGALTAGLIRELMAARRA